MFLILNLETVSKATLINIKKCSLKNEASFFIEFFTYFDFVLDILPKKVGNGKKQSSKYNKQI